MELLALTLPGGQVVEPPKQVPSGGLDVVQRVIGNALTIMIILAIVLVVISAVWAGVQWISSGGDKGKIAQARARLTWSIIGLIIALATFFILNIIGYFFNVNLLKLT